MFLVEKKWGDAERDKLYEALATLGVGSWKEARAKLLPAWDETALRVKASRLFGSQSLARYAGWKGDRASVETEYKKNKAAGDATGCWKSGVLVENDAGDVAKYFAAGGGGGGGGGAGADAGGAAGGAAAGGASEDDAAAAAAAAKRKGKKAKTR